MGKYKNWLMEQEEKELFEEEKNNIITNTDTLINIEDIINPDLDTMEITLVNGDKHTINWGEVVEINNKCIKYMIYMYNRETQKIEESHLHTIPLDKIIFIHYTFIVKEDI